MGFHNGSQRLLLPASGFELGVDGGKVVKLFGYFPGTIEGGMIIKHQLTKNFVDAVDLLQARSPVQQSKGVFTDL